MISVLWTSISSVKNVATILTTLIVRTERISTCKVFHKDLIINRHYFFFYWRIITLQNFVVFCQTSTWTSHKYTYVPSHIPPHPTALDWYRASVWVSWAILHMVSLNSNTLATWCKEQTHWKRPWCWERLRAGGEGDDRGWDGWMTSLTQWTWVWVNSRSWWWTGRSGMLRFMGSQRVGHDWATELNWTEYKFPCYSFHTSHPLFPSPHAHKSSLYV